MALSDYDWNQTRNEIIARAYRMIGKLSVGETLSSEMLDQGVVALNAMVKSWQNQQVFLWTLREFTQALTPGTASYSLASLDPQIYAIDKAYYQVTANDDDPVQVISYRQYIDIPHKDDPGDPYVVAFDNQLSPTIYVYPVPTVAKNLYYLGMVKLKDFDTANGNADFPVRWLQALTYGLARELIPEFGSDGGTARMIEGRFQEEFRIARTGEREGIEYEFVGGAFEK